MALLFSPYTLRGVTMKNRLWMSPMVMYCAKDGVANDFHMVHYGSRAVGGVGLMIFEATAIRPEGRITPGDLGIWSDEHRDALAPIAKFVKAQGCVPAIQLAHAGRKASCKERGEQMSLDEGGWTTIAPSAVKFDEEPRLPKELTEEEIHEVTQAWVDAARRAVEAGFEVIELHFAHGYLCHQFLSPLSNKRTDKYGGSFENRIRFGIETATAVRACLPDHIPLFARLSCTDWTEGGWDVEECAEFCRRLKAVGVDLIDCSTGGNVPHARIPVGPGYQVRFAEYMRHKAEVPTTAVGLITSAQQAEQILVDGHADAILMARQLLRDPQFPLHAARDLKVDLAWPTAYYRAKQC